MNTVDIDGPASIPLPLSPSPDQLQCHNISLYPDVVLRDPVDENYARSTDSELATSREDLTGKDTETVLLSDERAAEVVPDASASPPDEDRHACGARSLPLHLLLSRSCLLRHPATGVCPHLRLKWDANAEFHRQACQPPYRRSV